jgi:hypothetical protein
MQFGIEGNLSREDEDENVTTDYADDTDKKQMKMRICNVRLSLVSERLAPTVANHQTEGGTTKVSKGTKKDKNFSLFFS